MASPFAVTSSFYIEYDFEATARFTVGFPHQEADDQTTYYFAPALGVRYNLLTDQVRPQIFAEIAFYQFFSANELPHTSIFAFGGGAGLELFFHRDIARW